MPFSDGDRLGMQSFYTYESVRGDGEQPRPYRDRMRRALDASSEAEDQLASFRIRRGTCAIDRMAARRNQRNIVLAERLNNLCCPSSNGLRQMG